MSESSSIAPGRDFDLAQVESHGGWWMAVWSEHRREWEETRGESSWSEGVSRALDSLRPGRLSSVVEGWEERVNALQSAAVAFRSTLQARADSGRSYPATPLAPRSLLAAARTFLDQCIPEQFSMLRQMLPTGPSLMAVPRDPVVLVVPSNVVVAGMDAMQQAILVGCRRIVVRLPREGAAVLVDYARHVALASPDLGKRLILVRWPSPAAWPSSLAFPVLSFGGEQARQSLARQKEIPGLVHHGHQISIVVGRKNPLPTDLEALAWTTALHEQRGCLSPRLVLVSGLCQEELTRLADQLAEVLGHQEELPPGTTLVERAAVARRRDELWLELARRGEPDSASFGLAVSPTAEASVEWHETADLPFVQGEWLTRIRQGLGMAQGRHLVLVGMRKGSAGDSVSETVDLLGEILDGQPISALGYLDSAGEWARSIARAWAVHPACHRPIPWVAPVSQIQSPPLIHPLDGRPPLLDLVQLNLHVPPE